MINKLVQSQLYHQIQQENEIIQLHLLSEKKILFYLKNFTKPIFYDINLKETQKQLDIDYNKDNLFILSQNEQKLGIYNQQKQILTFYDMETNQRSHFKKRFKYIGVFDNQIIGIFKLAAIIIKFDGTYSKQLLPTYLLKKPYHISLAGNRILIRRWDQLHLLRFNQIYGYELKFRIKDVFDELNVQLVKTSQNLYFILGYNTGVYLYKNCNQFKKVQVHITGYSMQFQKILSYTQNRVCIIIDSMTNFLNQYQYMQLTDKKVLEGFAKYQIVASNQYIIMWNENKIYIFNN